MRQPRALPFVLLLAAAEAAGAAPGAPATPAGPAAPAPKPAAKPETKPEAKADPKAEKSNAAAEAKTVAQLVDRVQMVYEGTTDLRARFQQTTKGMMGTRKAEGEVWLKKPGKMRWDYERPDKKLFVADGTQLWVYEPEDEQAFKQPLTSSQLPAQVSFLFGKGRLQDDFEITALAGAGLGAPGDTVLKLVPKAPTAQYRYLAFVIDGKTAFVKETVVYDQQGGSNHIVFDRISTNVKGGLDDSKFQFTPPAGTRILSGAR